MHLQKCLVFIGAGRWQRDGIIAAKQLGYYTVAFDGDGQAPGMNDCDVFYNVNILDRDAVLKAMIDAKIFPDGVLSYCSEVGMLTAAYIRDYFRLAGPGVELTKLFLLKDVQRNFLLEQDIDNLNFKVVLSVDEGLNAINDFSLPVIVKPCDSSGSRGVVKVETISELKEALTLSFSYSKSKRAIIEEYIDGIEYTVETFTHNGETVVLAVTQKEKLAKSKGTVSIALSSVKDNKDKVKVLCDKVVSFISASGLKWGACHSELMISKAGDVKVVELAARGGGFGVFEFLLPRLNETCLSNMLCRSAVGDEVRTTSLGPRWTHFSLRFFPVFRSGTVTDVSGFDLIREDGVWADSFVKIGDRVVCENTDGSRLGYMLILASSDEELARKTEAVINKVRFEVDNESV